MSETAQSVKEAAKEAYETVKEKAKDAYEAVKKSFLKEPADKQ